MSSSQVKYRLLVEKLPDAFACHQIVTDTNNNPVDYIFIYVNPAFEEMFGFSRDRLLGKKITEVWPDNLPGTFDNAALLSKRVHFEHFYEPLKHCFRLVHKTKKTQLTEYQINVPGGGKYFEARTTPMDDRQLLTMVRDITDRKKKEAALKKAHAKLERKVTGHSSDLDRANEVLKQEKNEHQGTEKALLESEERYRSLINNTNETIVVLQDKFIKFANPMAEQLFGCPADEITSTPFFEFVHPDDRNIIIQRYKKRIKGQEVESRYTFRLKAGDGSIKWVENSTVLVEWEGKLAALYLINDITERKKMHEEITKSDKLESIGILAGGIAHDFNNFLAALLGNIALAKLYKDDLKKIYEKLDNMEKATLRARDLANQLFVFAKGSAPVKKKTSVNQLIVNDVKFALSGSNVLPKFSIAKDLHLVELDEGQFSQVLNNIVINAVQAMPEGGVIKVTAENVTLSRAGEKYFLPLPGGPYIKITIRDEGEGIPEKYLPKIFDPFFTTKVEGRGLGLATSYSIIKKHDGHLAVETEVGVGTSFFIFLPAIDKPGTTQEFANNIYRGTGKILIMDDEEELLKAMGCTLSVLGYEITLVKDGREAIDVYMNALEKGVPFDLVIMDLTIPGGLGGKLTIKELLQKDPDVKAIVASGYSSDPVMAKFYDYGFKGAIKKPFSLEELSKLIHDTIN